MKKNIYVLILTVIFFSCNKEKITYSCDPEVNAIVKSGVVEFSEISLTEFLEYDIVFQKAIFRTFSSGKKRDFWLEKLDLVITNYNFNIQEIEHLQKLVTHITPFYFDFDQTDPSYQSQREEFELYWKNYASDILLWDQSRVYFIVNSLCINENQYIQLRSQLNPASYAPPVGDCLCSTESDYCSDFGGSCSAGGCIENSGCGWLWGYTCNGFCD